MTGKTLVIHGKEIHFDEHHGVPRSRGGVSHKDNLTMMKVRFHTAFHQVFANMTPVEQIEFIALSVNAKVLTTRFKNDVKELVSLGNEPEYALKNGVYIPERLAASKKPR